MNPTYRKVLHVKLLEDTHAALKERAMRFNLTLQDVIEELATHVATDDQYMIDLLAACALRKSEGAVDHRGFRHADPDAFYDLFEKGST